MERHICAWHKENSDKPDEVGELIIDGNLIEFYSRFHGEVFPSTYIGGDGDRGYKVFVNGAAKQSERKSLDYSSSHRVFYVLMQNYQFSKGTDISGIVYLVQRQGVMSRNTCNALFSWKGNSITIS